MLQFFTDPDTLPPADAIVHGRTAREIFASVLFEAVGDDKKYLIPILREMKRRYGSQITVLCRYKEDIPHYRDLIGADNVHAQTEAGDFRDFGNERELMKKAQLLEEEYGLPLHYHMVDRRLFYTGASRFPWTDQELHDSYPAWVSYVVKTFAFYESLFSRYHFSFVLGGRRIACSIAEKRFIPQRRLFYCLFEDRMFWVGQYMPTQDLVKSVYEKLDDGPTDFDDHELKPPDFHNWICKQVLDDTKLHRVATNYFIGMIKGFLWRRRGYDKARVFGSNGRVVALHALHKRAIYRQMKSFPLAESSDLVGKPFVLYPLQLEPETLQAVWSPEFFDQIGIIHQLAKEMPIGTYLAVKEHVPSIGNRPIGFYEIFLTMPNVILVNPEVRALDLLPHAKAVAVLAGRTGFEAASYGIPVLSFARHCYFDFLPHVHRVDNLFDTGAALRAALQQTAGDCSDFVRAGRRLLAALSRVSVDPELLHRHHGEKIVRCCAT